VISLIKGIFANNQFCYFCKSSSTIFSVVPLHWHEGITSAEDLQNVPHNVAHNTEGEAHLYALPKGELTVVKLQGSDLACHMFSAFHFLSHILFTW